MEKKEKVQDKMHKVFTVIGIILCVILLPILIINITLIIKNVAAPDKVPDAGGYIPLIVLTDSMYPEIQGGDLIICHTASAESVQEGDVISFYDPAGSGKSIVTHRVIEIGQKDGKTVFYTKGDANNTADELPVPAESLVGIYQKRIPGAGNVAMFMQTTPGLLVCVLLPLVLLVGYDTIRRRRYNSRQKENTDALLAELEELRALKAQNEETASK